MMDTPQEKQRSERREARRSSPHGRGNPSPNDADECGVGELYLELYDAPALASTTGTYMEVYAVVRAILEHESVPHAQVAEQAARDAAAQHIERRLSVGGAVR